MRVVSWNIELGKNTDQAAHELQEFDQLASADIILLQEMSPESTARIADLVGMDARFDAVASHPATNRPFGNAVLSPWPMDATTSVPLPHTAPIQGQARAVTVTTVSVDGEAVLACSVHLETVLLDLRRRARQVQAFADHLAQETAHTPDRIVVGGDFNAASKRSLRAFGQSLETIGLTRVSLADGATFHRFGRSFALDHLFVRGLTAVDVGVIKEAEASDHQPVWAELDLASEDG